MAIRYNTSVKEESILFIKKFKLLFFRTKKGVGLKKYLVHNKRKLYMKNLKAKVKAKTRKIKRKEKKRQ